MGLTDLSELTGGKDGSASELIDELLKKDRNSPAQKTGICNNIYDRKTRNAIEQALEQLEQNQ